eukprot:14938221-Alexandrium_andersonii.AAC.1
MWEEGLQLFSDAFWDASPWTAEAAVGTVWWNSWAADFSTWLLAGPDRTELERSALLASPLGQDFPFSLEYGPDGHREE